MKIPAIVECVEDMVKNLYWHAANSEVFHLEEEATKVAINVIGKVICDHDFTTLTTDNDFLNTMRESLRWIPNTRTFHPFRWCNPLSLIYWKYYKYRMSQYLGKVLDEVFSARAESTQDRIRNKTEIIAALEARLKKSRNGANSMTAATDAQFRKLAINQLHNLLVAGHDAIASTLCHCYCLLYRNPHALAKMRQELDEVFGTGASATAQLKHDPCLINRCEYTLAVVKETLRLFTPGSTVRRGRKDSFVRDPVSGNMLPTEGLFVWVPSSSIHRDPCYWPDPHSFCPERFLPENEDKLAPKAYRPFENGLPNWIGQELALTELVILLACTMREFEVRGAYYEPNLRWRG
jgi:cytochrome P450